MTSTRSVLLNRELPPDLVRGLAAEGVEAAAAWLTAETDLNLAGSYETVYLLVLDDRIVTAAPPRDAHERHVRMSISRAEMTEARTRQGVGGGFLEVEVGGMYVEVLAYSNARADTFHKAAKKLEDWLKGRSVRVGPGDDENPRTCPKCGMTLEFKGDICRRCINQGAVATRVVRLMQPYAGLAAVMVGLLLCILSLQMVPPRLVGLLIDNVVSVKAGAAQLALPLPLWERVSRAVLAARPGIGRARARPPVPGERAVRHAAR